MSGILSASMTVRRREEALLVRARMDAIDAKLDRLVEVVTPTPPQDPCITTLARAIGQDKCLLPACCTIHRAFDDDGELIATGFTYDNLPFSIADAIKLKLISEDGRTFNHFLAATICHAVRSDGSWQHEAARPGRPHI
jgi:hypothetical protein